MVRLGTLSAETLGELELQASHWRSEITRINQERLAAAKVDSDLRMQEIECTHRLNNTAALLALFGKEVARG